MFINQYVVDDAAQTSSAGDHEGFGAYSLTYLGVELADLDTEDGHARRAGGRTTSTPRPR